MPGPLGALEGDAADDELHEEDGGGLGAEGPREALKRLCSPGLPTRRSGGLHGSLRLWWFEIK